jgi:hypothetical protein
VPSFLRKQESPHCNASKNRGLRVVARNDGVFESDLGIRYDIHYILIICIPAYSPKKECNILKINLLCTLLKFHYKALIISELYKYLGIYTGIHFNLYDYPYNFLIFSGVLLSFFATRSVAKNDKETAIIS